MAYDPPSKKKWFQIGPFSDTYVEAYNEGYKAALNHKQEADNPYELSGHERDTTFSDELNYWWSRGYHDSKPRTNGKVGFYGYMKDHTDFTPRNWKVGDEMDLPTLFGNCTFKIDRMDDKEIFWVSGGIGTRFVKEGEVWRWNHIIIDINAVCKVTIVN